MVLFDEPPPNIIESEDSPYSLTPLPDVLRHGLPAVAAFGLLSFTSSTVLLVFLSYKLVRWMSKPRSLCDDEQNRPDSPDGGSDYNGFLVPEEHLCPKGEKPPPVPESFWERLRKDPPNQFLVLILNLLFADIQQSMAFLLNIVWLSRDAIQVGTVECWMQGWFVSSGDLASSVFIALIAGHTYLGIVQGYRLPSWAFYSIIFLGWVFTYGISLLGIVMTDNGGINGGFYTRAGAWCWINSAYQDLRLYLHYLWIFLSLAITSVTYIIIFFHIRSLAHKAGRAPEGSGSGGNVGGLSRSNSSASAMSTGSLNKELPQIPSYARQQTFLLYPIIYVGCTVPIAAGRIAAMAGNEISLSFFCFAGAMIACNGWLDVLLYSTTRRGIVFSSEMPSQDTGLDTFAFMRTPPQRKFGNVVFVSGGQDPDGKQRRWKNWSEKVMKNPGKCGKLRSDSVPSSSSSITNSRNGSSHNLTGFGMGQGAVMGMAIQMETSTTVTVEEDTAPALSRKPSMASNYTKRTLTG